MEKKDFNKIQTNIIKSLWFITALISVGLFFFSVFIQNTFYQVPCPTSGCIDFGQLTLEESAKLETYGISLNSYAWFKTIMNLILGVGFFSVGIFLFSKNSSDKFITLTSMIMIAYGANFGMDILSQAFPNILFMTNYIDFVASGIVVFLFLYPDGRFVPKWTIVIAALWMIFSYSRIFMPDSFLNPELWPFWLDIVGWIGFYLLIFYAQLYRYRKISNSVQKQQAKWLIVSIIIIILHIGWIGAFGDESAAILKVITPLMLTTIIVIPVSLAIAILQYKLWNLDIYINRFVLYIMLSSLVVIIYASIIGILGTIFQIGGFFISFIAVGVTAILFEPIKRKLQAAINRFMYGESRSPYAALSMLGQKLEATSDTRTVLSSVVETISQVLKLPYAAIYLSTENSFQLAAEYGTLNSTPNRFNLVYQNDLVGELVIGTRALNEEFSDYEHRLIQDLARQVGIAAYSVKVTTDLMKSRESLVKAREEERKRIRRDLHDGLGPQLASLGMNIEAARNLYKINHKAGDELLMTTHKQLKDAINDIRQLVYDLRPPILDELGLIFAINEFISQYSQSEINFRTFVPPTVSNLPAAIEIATYRIIQESISNVIRHSKATECIIKITMTNFIKIEITDNGKGISFDAKKGIGMASMRERTEELNGTFHVISTPGLGLSIQAIFPLIEKEA
ncbi:sensor histidine kinase [Bacillus sp. JJ1566]|uniref:sensor histidine kinase n=1 Tax=Bacillus sp. JJ1566 TaxID=3122961 RepID=UPI0030002598